MIEKKIPVCFSSGTGRTGSLIAIDICMRSYESKRVVDILSCVSSMRKERAGVVQNKEQYALIYKVLVFITLSANSRKLLFRKKGLIQKSLCWTLGGILDNNRTIKLLSIRNGFLQFRNRYYYYKCNNCQLVFLYYICVWEKKTNTLIYNFNSMSYHGVS